MFLCSCLVVVLSDTHSRSKLDRVWCRGVRGIFFRGQIPILVEPKQISVVLKSEKQKKKKKKKSSPHFVTFPPSIFNFSPSLF